MTTPTPTQRQAWQADKALRVAQITLDTAVAAVKVTAMPGLSARVKAAVIEAMAAVAMSRLYQVQREAPPWLESRVVWKVDK